MKRKCPRCGERERDGGVFRQSGPVEGIVTCESCQFMWGKGDAGRGIEWWDDLKGWIRAPEGCMNVIGDAGGDYKR
jgi:hypothetical protein